MYLLHNAALLGKTELVKNLLQAGDDPNRMDNNGDTPLDCAHKSHKDALEFLQQSNLSASDVDFSDYYEVVKLLEKQLAKDKKTQEKNKRHALTNS